MQKAIIIKDCSGCPLSTLDKNDHFRCQSAAVVMKRHWRKRDVGLLGSLNSKIPGWCPLTGVNNAIIGYFIDNKIEIPQKLRDLALEEEGRLDNNNKSEGKTQ